MNVNGVTSVNDAYSVYNKQSESPKQNQDSVNKAVETVDSTAGKEGVVYEPSIEVPTKTYKVNSEVIERLKKEAQSHVDQLQAIVAKLISKQSDAFSVANDMWSLLRDGKLNVDPETRAQAQKDIAEDGYWGVEQTSSRIVDFATALTGGDPGKIEEMREAFVKGFKQAEKTWGGKLPEISQKTYDAVMKKFDKLAADAAQSPMA